MSWSMPPCAGQSMCHVLAMPVAAILSAAGRHHPSQPCNFWYTKPGNPSCLSSHYCASIALSSHQVIQKSSNPWMPVRHVRSGCSSLTACQQCSNSQRCGRTQVRHLLESIRKVRFNKIETGLRKVTGAITVKLNHLSAAECNQIRLLLQGTLDHFHQLSKVRKRPGVAGQPPCIQACKGARDFGIA